MRKVSPDLLDELRLVIKHPMDLSTVLRNVKAQKYKSKHAFGKDLDLIWENCLIYNAMEVGQSSTPCLRLGTPTSGNSEVYESQGRPPSGVSTGQSRPGD